MERFSQSIDALQQIALQSQGLQGRNNIVWVGHGGPGIYIVAAILTDPVVDKLKHYVHATASLLVDARMCLYVIYPGLPATFQVPIKLNPPHLLRREEPKCAMPVG